MRWCFDEENDLAFDGSTRLGVPDAEWVALIMAETTHHSLSRRVAELGGVFDMDKCPSTDDYEVRKVGVFTAKPFVQYFHLECRIPNSIAQV